MKMGLLKGLCRWGRVFEHGLDLWIPVGLGRLRPFWRSTSRVVMHVATLNSKVVTDGMMSGDVGTIT